jgi:hypothetical protein
MSSPFSPIAPSFAFNVEDIAFFALVAVTEFDRSLFSLHPTLESAVGAYQDAVRNEKIRATITDSVVTGFEVVRLAASRVDAPEEPEDKLEDAQLTAVDEALGELREALGDDGAIADLQRQAAEALVKAMD